MLPPSGRRIRGTRYLVGLRPRPPRSEYRWDSDRASRQTDRHAGDCPSSLVATPTATHQNLQLATPAVLCLQPIARGSPPRFACSQLFGTLDNCSYRELLAQTPILRDDTPWRGGDRIQPSTTSQSPDFHCFFLRGRELHVRAGFGSSLRTLGADRFSMTLDNHIYFGVAGRRSGVASVCLGGNPKWGFFNRHFWGVLARLRLRPTRHVLRPGGG